MENVMQVRVTGILIESEKVLLVKQKGIASKAKSC